jgi:hypothetical protein
MRYATIESTYNVVRPSVRSVRFHFSPLPSSFLCRHHSSCKDVKIFCHPRHLSSCLSIHLSRALLEYVSTSISTQSYWVSHRILFARITPQAVGGNMMRVNIPFQSNYCGYSPLCESVCILGNNSVREEGQTTDHFNSKACVLIQWLSKLRSKILWRWYISTDIMFLYIIHRPAFYLKTPFCLYFKTQRFGN